MQLYYVSMYIYRNAMIISISHDNILIVAQAESVGRVELSLATSELAELESDVHGRSFSRAYQRSGGSY